MRNSEADPDPIISEPVKSIGGHGVQKRRGPNLAARPTDSLFLLAVALLGSVCRAAALALTGVLAFAAVVARLAAALAFAGILAFAGMLVLGGIQRGRELTGLGGHRWVGAARCRSSVQTGHGAAQQAGEGCGEHQRVLSKCHVYFSPGF